MIASTHVCFSWKSPKNMITASIEKQKNRENICWFHNFLYEGSLTAMLKMRIPQAFYNTVGSPVQTPATLRIAVESLIIFSAGNGLLPLYIEYVKLRRGNRNDFPSVERAGVNQFFYCPSIINSAAQRHIAVDRRLLLADDQYFVLYSEGQVIFPRHKKNSLL